MIIEKSGTPVVTSDDFKEMSFDIKDEDKGLILEILRSKMYKNPIGSICREIASNGRDANREVGNNNPIQISISHSPFFEKGSTIVFKDEGPGISPDRMADVFVNYGSSTKRHSNAFTGGFGLGCKTPFSYTDSFCVITIVDKVQYTYIAAIEDQAKGKIYLVTKADTQDPNGTSIIVPIQEKDRDSFEKEVIRATFFWDTRPLYINFHQSIEDINFKVVKETDQYFFVKQYFFESNYGIVIDGILYPIDRSLINFSNQNLGRGVYIALKFKTGDLTISANRENLQYDEKTKAQILKKWEIFLDDLSQEILEKIKSVKSIIEACVVLYGFTKNPEDTLYDIHSTYTQFRRANLINAAFENQEHSGHVNFKISSKMFEFLKITRGGKTENKIFYDQDFLTLPIYICDKNKPTHFRNTTILQNYPAFIVIKPANIRLLKFSTLTFAEKRKLALHARMALTEYAHFQFMGMPIGNYSSIPVTKLKKDPSLLAKPKPPKTRTFYCKVTSVSALSVTKFCSSIVLKDDKYTYEERSGSDAVISDKPDQYLYYTVDSLIGLSAVNRHTLFLQNANKLGEISNVKIMFIQKKYESFFKGTFKSVNEVVDSLTEPVYKRMAEASIVKSLKKAFELLTAINFKTPRYESAVEELRALIKTYKYVNLADYSTETLVLEYEKELPTFDLKSRLAQIYDAFPLLLYLSTRPDWMRNIADIKSYVSLVEEALTLKGTL